VCGCERKINGDRLIEIDRKKEKEIDIKRERERGRVRL